MNLTASGHNTPTVTITQPLPGGSYTVIVTGVDGVTNRVPTSAEHAKGVPYRSHQTTYFIDEGEPPVPVEHTAVVNDSKVWPVEVVWPELAGAVRNALDVFCGLMIESWRASHQDVNGGATIDALFAVEAVKGRTLEAVNLALTRAAIAPIHPW